MTSEKVTISCVKCGKEIEGYFRKLEGSKFCSDECEKENQELSK